MQSRIKVALLLGAVMVTGATAALAAMNARPQQVPPAGNASYRGDDSHAGRGGGRFLADNDLNHDGKVTRDEYNKAAAQRFAQMANGAPVSAPQFANAMMKKHRDREAEYFHRADWNGDGKLSLDEYLAPLRNKFGYMDRDGIGLVDCAARSRSARAFAQPSARPQAAHAAYQDGARGGDQQRHRGGGRGVCPSDDLNMDGKVTRAEYDKSNTQKFAEVAHGGKTLSLDQYMAVGNEHFLDVNARIFGHLDTNEDGKLTLAEYMVSQQRTFARIDHNNDGVLTKDELAVQPRRGDDYRGGAGGRSTAAMR